MFLHVIKWGAESIQSGGLVESWLSLFLAPGKPPYLAGQLPLTKVRKWEKLTICQCLICVTYCSGDFFMTLIQFFSDLLLSRVQCFIALVF